MNFKKKFKNCIGQTTKNYFQKRVTVKQKIYLFAMHSINKYIKIKIIV